MSGKSAVDALADALDRLAQKILDNSIDTLFAGLGTSTASKGIFGGSILPGILHSGGIAGNDNYPHRAVSPAVFAGAPRYHGGGIAGLKPDEVPAILQRGERVLPRGAKATSDGSISVTIQNNFDARGAYPESIAALNKKIDSAVAGQKQAAIDAIREAKSRQMV
jgi:hypothetical protein